MEKSAQISECQKYRWKLTRKWSFEGCMVFVLLNPSTADHLNDDPTLRRCLGYAKREGFGSLQIVNLFAFRSSSPRDLNETTDPVGAENHTFLEDALSGADCIVCGWGASKIAVPEMEKFLRAFGHLELQCLGKTKSGAPKHPLYLKTDAPLIPYP